jgi:carbon monoxide dehydrogenase subunit G
MEFSREFAVAAPADRVWAVMRDVERWHEWTASVTSVRIVGGGPLRVGSRAWVKQPKFPTAYWKVSELDDARRTFTWISRGPRMLVAARHGVDSQETGSRAYLTLRYDGLLGPLFGNLTRGITERYLDLEAEGLKRRSEGG